MAGQRYICVSCGFIYDPAEGDPDGGVPPGTQFDDIPNDWFCQSAELASATSSPWIRRLQTGAFRRPRPSQAIACLQACVLGLLGFRT